jgi:hypothetical protein
MSHTSFPLLVINTAPSAHLSRLEALLHATFIPREADQSGQGASLDLYYMNAPRPIHYRGQEAEAVFEELAAHMRREEATLSARRNEAIQLRRDNATVARPTGTYGPRSSGPARPVQTANPDVSDGHRSPPPQPGYQAPRPMRSPQR